MKPRRAEMRKGLAKLVFEAVEVLPDFCFTGARRFFEILTGSFEGDGSFLQKAAGEGVGQILSELRPCQFGRTLLASIFQAEKQFPDGVLL